MEAKPERIGRYVVERAIGRGAMGLVYQAHDPDIDRLVAIKLIRADLLDGEDQAAFVARFRREAQAAGRCSHPNIVAVYDFGLHEGNPFIAMEFVDGTSLGRAWEEAAQVAPADAANLMLQALAGLGAAHQAGIVHRDIKPANIMLTRNGRVKVADFGISRIDSSTLTSDGMVVGTPSYMSPEQCRGAAVDGRSDLFSVGVILFELLTGQKPFAGRSAPEIYMKLLNEEAPDIATLRPDLPMAMRQVVARSLAKAADERYPTAEAMASALRRAALQSDETAANTIVLRPLPVANPETAASSFDPEVIDTLQRKLAAHVGPIARHLVDSAARSSANVAALCAAVAVHIESEAGREQFAQEMRGQVARVGSGVTQVGQTAGAVPAMEVQRLTTELTRHLGPVAKVLVKRALPAAGSAGALWRTLAAHIENAQERANFLRNAPP